MSDFDSLMQSGYALCIAAAVSRGNIVLWQESLHGAIAYTCEALLVCNEDSEHARAYSQLAEIYQQLGDLDLAERYIQLIFDYVPDDIIAYSQLLQLACLRYRHFSVTPLPKKANRKKSDPSWYVLRVDSAMQQLCKNVRLQMLRGNLNATVYIRLLKQAVEFVVPWMKSEAVRELYQLILVGPWHNFFISDEIAPEFTALQRSARNELALL